MRSILVAVALLVSALERLAIQKRKTFRSNLVFVMTISVSGCFSNIPDSASEGVVRRLAVEGADYCHLWFPEIREDTLNSARPQLKDPRDGNLVYLYGPCDYDPLGTDAISRQREAAQREQRLENR